MRNNRATRELCSLDPCRRLLPCRLPRWCPTIRGCCLSLVATLLFPAAVGSLWWLRDTYFDLRREPQHVLHTVKLKALNVDCSQLGENWSDRTTADWEDYFADYSKFFNFTLSLLFDTFDRAS